MLVAIVAVDENGGIGLEGTMPWHCPEDLQHFKETTMNHKVILGRVTYSNLTQELTGREIIVASRNSCSDIEVMTFSEIIEAYADSDETVFVAGGQTVYKELLSYCSKVLVSRIPDSYEVDRYFPMDQLTSFTLADKEQFESFTLEIYKRII